MSKQVLVTPIGKAPGAIAGAFFALRERGHHISQVVTVGTAYKQVLESESVLGELFREVEDVAYAPVRIDKNDLKADDGSAEAYMALIGDTIEQARAENDVVHVCVTGGRSGMGALAALATNFYGADYVWHYWAVENLVLEGELGYLSRPASPDDPALHPQVAYDDDEYELVPLPVVDLSPLRPLLNQYRETGEYPDPNSVWTQLATHGNVGSLAALFSEDASAGAIDNILQMAGRPYNTLNDAEQRDFDIELAILLNEIGIDHKSADGERIKTYIQAGGVSDAIKENLREQAKQSRLDPVRKVVYDLIINILGGYAVGKIPG